MATAEITPVEREVIRCHSCLLNQFMPTNKHCRKCKVNLAPELAVVAPEVAQETADDNPRHWLAGVQVFRIDLAIIILRTACHLSQRQLATKMDKPRTYVSKIENGKAQPTLSSIQQFAAALDVTPAQLVEFALVS